MKISKLINELSTFNQDADVTLTTSEDITLSFIFKNMDTGEILTKKTTRQVFIEPCDQCPECTNLYYDCEEGMCSFYNKPCKEVEECYQFEEVNNYE